MCYPFLQVILFTGAFQLSKGPRFVYTVDIDVRKLLSLEPRTWDFIYRLKPKVGLVEHIPYERVSGDLISIIDDVKKNHCCSPTRENGSNLGFGSKKPYKYPTTRKPKIAVVGSGPSGLFASLVLAGLGADVTLIERGQAVEQRGRDIGALIVRRVLQMESNFCFGEVISPFT